MTKNDVADVIFQDMDKNQDGKIDKHEMREWISGERLSPTSRQSYIHEQNVYDNNGRRFERNKSRGGVITTVGEVTSDQVIHTSSSEETNRYIERSGGNVYKDPHPQIIRRTRTDGPVTYEQRIRVRYLQPPPIPPPGPLIIKEVRPEQPPALPPLVIRQQETGMRAPSPLIFRERPPIPPAAVPGETVTRLLPPIPVPPRSLIIERFPAPEKPRDIIIERWLPYSTTSERRKIVEPAPPPPVYPDPKNVIVIYENVEARIVRRFENLGVTQESPEDYISRYGASLLDPNILIQRVRSAGVTENLPPPTSASLTNLSTAGSTVHFESSNEHNNNNFLLSGALSSDRIDRVTGKDMYTQEHRRYTSSTSNFVADDSTGGSVTVTQTRPYYTDA